MAIFISKKAQIYIWYSYYPYITIFVIKKIKMAKNILDKKVPSIGILIINIPTTSILTSFILQFL